MGVNPQYRNIPIKGATLIKAPVWESQKLPKTLSDFQSETTIGKLDPELWDMTLL